MQKSIIEGRESLKLGNKNSATDLIAIYKFFRHHVEIKASILFVDIILVYLKYLFLTLYTYLDCKRLTFQNYSIVNLVTF